jgi:hypothetical protein
MEAHRGSTCIAPVILNLGRGSGPAFAHGTTGAKRTVGAPPYIKICKKCEALQYCNSNELIELTEGKSRAS